jgi:prepilin-type N-terminal cleavage/methylation domain-containing protein
MMKVKKLGFTLVEISIVLVIIGLLIGGILIGNSLIETARVNRLVSDLKQYEVATIQFQKKFKKYPGDSQFFTPPGNGNNLLNMGANGLNNCAAAPNATLSNREAYQFWAHLSQSKMLKANYPAYSPANGGSYGNCNGTHSDEDLNEGKITPYTKVDSLGSNFSITVGIYNAGDRVTFEFFTSPSDTLALENKLGVKPFNPNGLVGLTNYEGINKCYDIDGMAIDCGNSSASWGNLGYYLPPQ